MLLSVVEELFQPPISTKTVHTNDAIVSAIGVKMHAILPALPIFGDVAALSSYTQFAGSICRSAVRSRGAAGVICLVATEMRSKRKAKYAVVMLYATE